MAYFQVLLLLPTDAISQFVSVVQIRVKDEGVRLVVSQNRHRLEIAIPDVLREGQYECEYVDMKHVSRIHDEILS